MRIRTKLQVNFGIFCLFAGYMISHEIQTFYGEAIREYLTLRM